MLDTDQIPAQPGVPAHTITRLHSPRWPFALVIPVINENGRLLAQLAEIRDAAPRVDIIIADGGSTDGSTEPYKLRQLGVTTLLTKTDPGKLSAQLRIAIYHCLQLHYGGVISMDGNGKDGVDGIDRIATALSAGYDFIQGSRFVRGGKAINTPRHRLLAIRLIHAPMTSLAARYRFTDTTNGFRGHSRRLLEDPRVAPLRDAFNTYELLAYLPIRAAQLGYKIAEVPVSRSYPDAAIMPTKISGPAAHIGLLRILFGASRGNYDPP